MFSRRTIVTGAASAVALAACGQNTGTEAAKEAMNKVAVGKRKIDKIGIQSYTLRKALAEDFKGTFQMIKDVGYDYVELNERNFSEKSPQQLKAILDEIGLPSPSSHINYDRVIGETDAIIAAAKTLGAKYIVVPYMVDDQRSLEDWKRHSKAMNIAGEKFADAGLRLAYHNHQFEFDDLGGGTTAMEILLNETSAENLDFELDLFWAALASVDVPSLVLQGEGRFKLCHIKDLKGDPKLAQEMSYDEIGNNLMVNVGEGQLDFESLFAMNDVSGLEYFIAEHDHPKMPYREAIATSYNAIRNMRF